MIHVVKASAAEAYEQQKYDRKAQELREHHFQSERLQETNGAWMSLYFTCTLGSILWFGGWEVARPSDPRLNPVHPVHEPARFPIRQAARVIDSLSRAISSGQRFLRSWIPALQQQTSPQATEMQRPRDMCACTPCPSRMTPVSRHCSRSRWRPSPVR